MPRVTLQAPLGGLPPTIDITSEYHPGGEACVFFTVDGRWAVKIYNQLRPEYEPLLRYVMSLFKELSPEHARFILPPLALAEAIDGKRCTGFVMRRVPPRYRELLDFMITPVAAADQFRTGHSWGAYLRVARAIAHALVALHNKGCGHSDIHFRNFLADIDEGDAVMLEADGIVVPEYKKPSVSGMVGFAAPEVLADGVEPSVSTDLHSLPVLLLHTLLFRNVMTPLRDYAPEAEESDWLGFGRYAAFSEDPRDSRNLPSRLGMPLFRRGELSYLVLPPRLQTLTQRALIKGLRDPGQRPDALEWLEALSCAVDELYRCARCPAQHYPYPYWLQPLLRRACPFCGQRPQPPLPAVLALYEHRHGGTFVPINRYLVLGHGYRLHRDTIEPGRSPGPARRRIAPVGYVVFDAYGQGHLVNDTDDRWTSRHTVGGPRLDACRGQSIPLEAGRMIRFGDTSRLMLVHEAGGRV
jgi:DNA-binding helix-hairpin-helix protein with protein kinase domain